MTAAAAAASAGGFLFEGGQSGQHTGYIRDDDVCVSVPLLKGGGDGGSAGQLGTYADRQD